MEGFERPLDEALNDIPSPIEAAARVFRQSLVGSLSVAAIPYTMVNQHVVGSHSQRILIAERIRALKYDATHNEEQRESLARGVARTRFSEFVSSQEGKEKITGEILKELRELLEVSDMAAPFQELLLESIVMMWGTFETFISDSTRSILNHSPSIASSLLQSDEVRRISSIKHIAIEDLASRGFDMSRSMGDYVSSELRFDSFPVLKAVVGSLLPEASKLQELLRKPEFWMLWQRRNLIAHKRGVVDRAYLSKTRDVIAEGSRLIATGQYVEQVAIMLRDSVVAFIEAARVPLARSSL
jgi:hypothetical protein